MFCFYNFLLYFSLKNKRHSMPKIGIIGGSGLENLNVLEELTERHMNTPYGLPSSSFFEGKFHGLETIILSRHGRKHMITPTGINNRANIWALREMGCTQILATTACGSLQEKIGRGDLVVLDQFIDWTKNRRLTFFDDFLPQVMNHTPMADPFSEELRKVFIDASKELGIKLHQTGTVISIEGPRFSTRAESKMFRMFGADVINMTTAPECILANEMNIPYAAVALSTDYDSWKDDEEPVSWEAVMEIFEANVKKITQLLLKSLQILA